MRSQANTYLTGDKDLLSSIRWRENHERLFGGADAPCAAFEIQLADQRTGNGVEHMRRSLGTAEPPESKSCESSS